jgi:hypothetical protein
VARRDLLDEKRRRSGPLAKSFERNLRAGNKAIRTVATYGEGLGLSSRISPDRVSLRQRASPERTSRPSSPSFLRSVRLLRQLVPLVPVNELQALLGTCKGRWSEPRADWPRGPGCIVQRRGSRADHAREAPRPGGDVSAGRGGGPSRPPRVISSRGSRNQ